MSIFQTGALLIVGLIVLGVGIKRKKKWVMVISAIPLLVVLWQILLLVGMAFS
ncbi:MAG: hypothetical protein FWG87_13080 [Defluviitaleaceae bacterium]|nr:hypothetical protein [Defluviitaleaceae bacterium]